MVPCYIISIHRCVHTYTVAGIVAAPSSRPPSFSLSLSLCTARDAFTERNRIVGLVLLSGRRFPLPAGVAIPLGERGDEQGRILAYRDAPWARWWPICGLFLPCRLETFQCLSAPRPTSSILCLVPRPSSAINRPLSKWWIDSANLLESEEIVKSTGTGWKGREGGEDEVTYTGWKVGVSESEGDATERPQTGSLQTRQSRARNCYQLCGGGEEYGTVSGRASSLPPPPLS